MLSPFNKVPILLPLATLPTTSLPKHPSLSSILSSRSPSPSSTYYKPPFSCLFIDLIYENPVNIFFFTWAINAFLHLSSIAVYNHTFYGHLLSYTYKFRSPNINSHLLLYSSHINPVLFFASLHLYPLNPLVLDIIGLVTFCSVYNIRTRLIAYIHCPDL